MMVVATQTLEAILRHDRQIAIGGLVAASLGAWLYILAGAGMEMDTMSAMPRRAAIATARVWTPAHFLMMLAMWWVMMVAMMLPSASPMVLLFAAVS